MLGFADESTCNPWATKWCESGPEPVYAESSATKESAFVRVMLLPIEHIDRRNIHCTDRTHADRPTRPRARVFLEEPLS